MNYNEALEYLDSLNVFGMKLGLERMTELLRLLGNPQNDYKCVHITGTNGKGSVTAMLASIMKASGFRTGMFISPHLSDYTERVQINGKNVTPEQFAIALSAVRDMCEFMTRDGNEQPTQFEVLTAVAFLLFKSEEVEYAIIEVGLGGLLDSTNVIMPKLSVITNVSFEHADKCGGTLEGITEHKAGIIKENVPVLTGASGIPLDIITRRAKELNSNIYIMGRDFETEAIGSLPTMDRDAGSVYKAFSSGKSTKHIAYQMVNFSGKGTPFGNMDYKMKLLGMYQISNSGLAVAAAMILATDELSITKQSIRKGMAEAVWQGRFELIEGAKSKYGHDVLIDGAHNPAGITRLRESLDYYFPDKKRVFLLGILKDKDYEHMLEILFRKEDEVVFTLPLSDRAADPEELIPFASVEKKEAVADYREALNVAHKMATEDSILICAGSLYLIGNLRKLLI